MTDKRQTRGAFDVNRKIALAPVATERLQEAARQLRAIEPVIDAQINRRGQLHISYDASSVGMRDIEAILDKSGIVRAESFWWKLKLAWYRFVDENAKSNARSVGGACCNRPPSEYSGSSAAGKIRSGQHHD
ncbi:MAG: hypothetical protein K8H84_07490 [Sulfuricella denitrificans]|nr:hypothetical protein [Sulfuricella denitrificans]